MIFPAVRMNSLDTVMTILIARMWETGAPTQSLSHAASLTLPDWNTVQENSVSYNIGSRLHVVYTYILRYFVHHDINTSYINILSVIPERYILWSLEITREFLLIISSDFTQVCDTVYYSKPWRYIDWVLLTRLQINKQIIIKLIHTSTGKIAHICYLSNDSSVGIENRLRARRQRNRRFATSKGKKYFLFGSIDNSSRTHQASHRTQGLIPRRSSGRGMKLTTHLFLIQGLGLRGSTPSLAHGVVLN